MIDLQEALDLAVALAYEAGEMIRRDFHRPGGPRGGGDKAEVDNEVEAFLRERLLGRFPGWSYTGEETGHQEGTLPYRWVLDPQDGTRVFLNGYRGSSVSIGVLFEDEPVLGVVYSPTYPDDRGDMIAWARGCGPVRRNGQELSPPEWPAELRPHDVVLVSQHADRRAPGNLECVQPARFRKMPSVAYRMALVAAGEGVGGVSLAGVQAHDVVACHALLRAQGGELVNDRGEPMTYRDGVASTFAVYGGGKEVVQILRQRPWGQALQGVRAGTGGFLFPVELAPDQHIADPDLLSRAQGMLLGLVAGGAPGEPGRLVGQPSVSAESALALARTLLEGGSPRAAYSRWLDSGPSPEFSKPLVRCTPLALYSFRDLSRLDELGAAAASLTHSDPVTLEANRVYLRALAAALQGGNPLTAAAEAASGPVADALMQAHTSPQREGPESELSGLRNAFYSLEHAASVEHGVLDALMHGNGAGLAGALLGASRGRDALPWMWRHPILSCRPYRSGQPRPAFCWPVDVHEIAECLLLCGAS